MSMIDIYIIVGAYLIVGVVLTTRACLDANQPVKEFRDVVYFGICVILMPVVGRGLALDYLNPFYYLNKAIEKKKEKEANE